MDEHGQFAAGLIGGAARAYAAGAVRRQLEVQPDVFERYGTAGFDDLAGDTGLRLTYLQEALAAGRSRLLEDQVAWQKVAMVARDVPVDCLRVNLSCLRDELRESLPAPAAGMAADYLERAARHLDAAPSELPSLLEGDAPHLDLTRRYLLAVLETRRRDAVELLLRAVEDGVSVPEIHQHVIARAQAEIGRMWQMNEVHVAEEHYGTHIVHQALAELRVRMPRAPASGRRVVCTTVGGDLHDVGLQMVADHFEMAGWEPVLLGASTPAPDLAHALRDFAADLLAISTSVATQIRATAALIAVMRAYGPRPDLPIVVGGTPFVAVPDLWQVVGADGHADDAAGAVAAAERLLRAG